jgi:hypothetical protein
MMRNEREPIKKKRAAMKTTNSDIYRMRCELKPRVGDDAGSASTVKLQRPRDGPTLTATGT